LDTGELVVTAGVQTLRPGQQVRLPGAPATAPTSDVTGDATGDPSADPSPDPSADATGDTTDTPAEARR
jgi:hypothetical protein